MIPLHSLTSSHFTSPPTLLFFNNKSPKLPSNSPKLNKTTTFTFNSLQDNAPQFDSNSNPKLPPRTLFPGGYKRAEIRVPNIVLQLTAEEVLNGGGSVLDFVDGAVAKWVGIVVVSGSEGGGGGGKLYEAACLLKSVIRNRAFLLVDERVDIAAAVNATGVLLSDQGLPPIVARNTMMNSKSELVVLPVVGRIVQTVNAALNAAKSEGADFLIFSSHVVKQTDLFIDSIYENVKIPVFVESTCTRMDGSLTGVSKTLMSGASGVVATLEELMSSGDALGKLLDDTSTMDQSSQKEVSSPSKLNMMSTTNGFAGGIDSFVKLDDSKAQFIKKEKHLLVAAANAMEKAAPLMEEISLLNDAISQLDEPFLLVIVGEYNSGKSTFINALLGGKFLEDGVVPTTNEITFLRHSDFEIEEQQRRERNLDGQYICYLPCQILKKMIIVDTPGTNVILQRQQRLTEEFVPRADLLLFVLSADRPLSESEVGFLRYTQQWKKKVVFLLNKADMYRNSSELEEAITFVRENVQKLLNVDDVKLFPISARSALEAKLATAVVGTDQQDLFVSEIHSNSHRFLEFENFLYGFLDGSTTAGLERMKLKLETPIAIADRLLSSCQTLVTQDYRYAKKDLSSVEELMGTVEESALRMESESAVWKRQILSLVESAEVRVLKLVASTLLLSNLDLAFSLFIKGDRSASIPASQSIQNDIIGPALSDAERLLGNYTVWLKEYYVREVTRYKETFEKRWPSAVDSEIPVGYTTNYLLREFDPQSIKFIEKFSGAAASKLFDQEIREVFFGAVGGLGAAGLSASLLTSVLPTTLEDLLALGLCSAGGLLAISNFPARRQKVVDSVKSIADAVRQEIEEAMQKDLLATIKNVEDFVVVIGKPYEEAAQQRLSKLQNTQEQLTDIEKKLQTLQIELQNFHLS